MEQEDIIRMAREAGMAYEEDTERYIANIDDLQDFAKLVAAAEREACAKAVEQSKVHQYVWYPKGSTIDANRLGEIYQHQHEACVEAILARGQQ